MEIKQEIKQEDNYSVLSKNKKRSFSEYNYSRGMQMSSDDDIIINKKFKIFGIEIKTFW